MSSRPFHSEILLPTLPSNSFIFIVAEMIESMFSSMTTSMEMAQECLKQEKETAQPFEGLEKFAQTIEAGMGQLLHYFCLLKNL